MYIALGLMFLGMLAGICLRRLVALVPLQKLVFAAVLGLLFLLGAQIGLNDRLFADLPHLGATALLIAILCMAGSIAAVLGLVLMRQPENTEGNGR